MTDHIHVINQLKEKCRDYICTAFVDYKKIYSVQTVLTSLQEQGIENVYIEHLNEIYTNSSMIVHLHKESNTINTINRSTTGRYHVTQLFTAPLEIIFR